MYEGDFAGHDDYLRILRAVVDSSVYMTLGTANAQGRPWVSPVFFSTDDYVHFYWVSSSEAVHSQSIEVRHEVAIVIFASDVPPGSGQGVYMNARAHKVLPEDLAHAIEIYPGPAERGGGRIPAEELLGQTSYRMYCATATEHSILCPRGSGPCVAHGLAFDHRIGVRVNPTQHN
ncbi:MAG TPA: pyridoxamine 5'-phosphate oxidase family protein [Acidimicrobiales bacterium]|jgi:hypothetical protein